MEGGRSPSKEDPPHPVLHSLGGPRGSRDASPPPLVQGQRELWQKLCHLLATGRGQDVLSLPR